MQQQNSGKPQAFEMEVGAPADFLSGSSEMAGLIARHDWSSTALGPLDLWPQSLKTIVGMLVRSPLPIVLLWGEDGYMIYNDAYSVFAEERHPRLLGSKVREGWPEVAAFNDNVMRVGLAGGTLAYRDQELTLHRKGKPEQVWMNLDYSPVIGESGAPAGVIAFVVDTTDRVLAERRQADATARQRRQFEQAPGFMIIMSGPDHLVEFVNNTHRKVFGSHDWTGKTIREAFPSIADQGFFEVLDAVYTTGKTFQFENAEVRYARSLSGPSEVRFLTFNYAPIFDVDGSVTGVFCDGFDVTETHRVQSALQASEARLRELNASLERKVIERTQARGRTWQLSPDLLGALNSEGYFETSNPAWQTMLGWSEDEVARMSIFELLHPDDIQRTKDGFALTQQGQPAIRFPNRYRRKDGDYRWISWVGIPDDGIVYCSGRDITDEKEAETELAKAQEALRQSQKMEAIGQLTGGIAHDFNNLLAGISGSLEVIDNRITQGRFGDIDRFIVAAKGSARRAAALTQRLLAFSRRQTLDPKPTNINRLIYDMEEMVRRTIGPSVELQIAGSADLWRTRVDQLQLENALLNLAINARDAMPDGGRITIQTVNKRFDERQARERDLAPGDYILISVSDTGTGMTPDVMAQAFDPFFTTKPIGQGTGLGLSMIHGFVRQSGGQVRIESAPGRGATMRLYLPRFAGELEQDDATAEPSPVDEGRGETILVIDDDATVRMLIVEVLQEAGYVTLDADDGPSGLAYLQSGKRIDLLVTDVGLPGGLNGRQVADAARATRPNLKVLFVTGYADKAAVGSGHLDAGMQVITKPFSMGDFTARVRGMIETK